MRFSDQGDGQERTRLRPGGDRYRAQARARLRPGDGADASQPPGQVPERHLRGARHLAGAARRPLPRALRSSFGSNGAMTLVDSIGIKRLGRVEYLPTLAAMKEFTSRRNGETADELWLLEHPPVYTLGQEIGRASCRERV